MLALPAKAALAPPPPPSVGCYPVPVDRMNCAAADLDLLVTELVRCEGEREILKLQLKQAQMDLGLCRTELGKWPLACPVLPPPPPPKDPLWPVLGYVGGVLGTLALATALGVPMPDPLRWGVGVAGAATIGIGVVLVLP